MKRKIMAIVLSLTIALGNYGDTLGQTSMVSKAATSSNWLNVKKIVGHDTDHKGIITENNDLYTWGNNFEGAAGIGDESITSVDVPTKILSNVKEANLGSTSSALTYDNEVYIWGYDFREDSCSYSPIKIAENVKEYLGGCFLTIDGDLYTWENNYHEQSGDGNNTEYETMLPNKILSNVKSVFRSDGYTGAITENSDLYIWGDWSYCDDESDILYSPKLFLSDVKQAIVGYRGGAVKNDGSVYTWERTEIPKQVSGVSNVSNVFFSDDYYFITNNNELITYINSGYDVLLKDVKEYSDNGETLYAMHAAITNSGDLYVWGDNQYGLLGNGGTENNDTPTKILSDVGQFSLDGYTHIAAVTNAGELYLWGENKYGEIGNGTKDNCYNPYCILSNVSDISMSLWGSAAITSDGKCYVWGLGSFGGNIKDMDNPFLVCSDGFYGMNKSDNESGNGNNIGNNSSGSDSTLTDYNTSTDGVCAESSIAALLGNSDYSSYVRSMRSIAMVIPGLKQTNMGNGEACHDMVPQGICVTNDYILISAYCHNLSESKGEIIDSSEGSDVRHRSVIYVINKDTKKYITTIILSVEDDAGLKAGNHVGGLAFGNNTVYIAGSGDKKVWKLPYEAVSYAVSSGKDTYTATISKNHYISTIKASFIYWDDSYQELFVGNFDDKDASNNFMYSYNLVTGKATSSKIQLPKQTQGVSFFGEGEGKVTHCICSKSWGKNNQSEMYVAELKKIENAYGYTLTNWHKITTPNMSEDIQVLGSTLYNCFESAANYYNNGGKKMKETAFDRIPYIGVRALLSSIMKKGNETDIKKSSKKRANAGEDETEDNSGIYLEGSCGENLNYCLYDDGELLVSGQGNMEDYSEDTAPWSAYKDDITSIYIDRGVTGIGEYAFYNCVKLTDIVVSEFMNADVNFVIGEYAFYNCSLLHEIRLPDISFDIKGNAFNESADIQFSSNSNDIKKYTENHANTTLHQHGLKYVKTVEATCLENGYDLYQCECGYEEVSNIIEATAEHSYKEVERSEATETDEGFIKYQCENCIDTFIETLEAVSPTVHGTVYIWRGEITGWGGPDSYPSSATHAQGSGEKNFYYAELTNIKTSKGYGCGLEFMNPYNPDFTGDDNEMSQFIKQMKDPRIKVTLKNGGTASSWNWATELSFQSQKEIALPEGYLDNGYFVLFGNDDVITQVEIYDIGQNDSQTTASPNPSETMSPEKTTVPDGDNVPYNTQFPSVTGAPSIADTPFIADIPSVTYEPSDNTKPSKVSGLVVKNKKKKKMVISWYLKANVSGFQIQYAQNKKFTKKKKNKLVGQLTSEKTISKLTKGKTYYVRVRAYKELSGEKIYGKWSKIKKVKIRK